ncbi:DUF1579 family protein [Chitinophaga sp. 22620]|uniref:DUF1579 family protein n=1 Tax=Chitinophaga sp. 22620 TaxID=3453952 RepID=UPI003F850B1E
MKAILSIPTCTILALIATSGTPLTAQDNKDEQMKQRIELSKTGENHALLSNLAGSWSFSGSHFPPNAEPVTFKGLATRKPVMDGRYFIFETTGGKLVMPWSDGKEVAYQDMIIEAYDNQKKKFVNAMIANHWNTGIAVSEGVYDPATRTITYEAETGARPGMKMIIRSLMKITGNDQYTVEIYSVLGDKIIKRSEINYTRVKGE